ncbi:hypothetical protein TKK_0006091 [Trichogramma kaykai]
MDSQVPRLWEKWIYVKDTGKARVSFKVQLRAEEEECDEFINCSDKNIESLVEKEQERDKDEAMLGLFSYCNEDENDRDSLTDELLDIRTTFAEIVPVTESEFRLEGKNTVNETIKISEIEEDSQNWLQGPCLELGTAMVGKENRLFANLRVKGAVYKALLDSGAQCCIAGPRLMEDLKPRLEDSRAVIKFANQELVAAKKRVKVQMDVDNRIGDLWSYAAALQKSAAQIRAQEKMAANARPERMVTLGRIPAQSVRKQLANEGVMVSRKVVTEVAGSEVTVRGGQPGETGIDGQHLMYVSIPEKMIGANNPGTWDDSNEDPFWIEVPIKLTRNQKRRVRKARLEQLQARPLPTLAQFLPQPQAPVEIPVLPGVGAGKGPVEGSRAEGPVLEEEIGLEDISLSGLDISEEMEEQLLMETEPSQVAGNAAVNTERAQRVEDAAWKKYEANIEKARKIVGCYFGSLVLVPWTEGVDPEIGACFKCHRMGHVHAECTVPVDVPFCKNCGRKGVTVCRCPRCRLAWKRQKGEWMRGKKPKKLSPLQSEGRVMVTIPSTPPVVQESERPVEATMNERRVRWQDDRRGRSPLGIDLVRGVIFVRDMIVGGMMGTTGGSLVQEARHPTIHVIDEEDLLQEAEIEGMDSAKSIVEKKNILDPSHRIDEGCTCLPSSGLL